jgi:hypothetical protein
LSSTQPLFLAAQTGIWAIVKMALIVYSFSRRKKFYETNLQVNTLVKEGLQKSFLRTRHPIKSMAYVLFIGEKLSFAEVS